MVWQHKSRGHWFCTDIKPLEIEVKILSSGSVAWQVKNKAGVFFRDKAASPRIAMECATIHAIEIADHFKAPLVEQFKEEVKVEKIVDPSDFTYLPDPEIESTN